MEFVGILCLILVMTTLASHFSRRVGIPAVIGQLLVGLVLGQAGFNWVHPDALVEGFSEIGVILLMFLAGLESDLSLLKKYFKPGMFVAGLGIIFPVLFGIGSGLLFNISTKESFFLGLILAATSVSISVEVLKELKTLGTKEGATILGASVVDDILVVLMVSLSMTFLASNSGQGNQSIIWTLVQEGLFFVISFFVIKWVAPYLIRLSHKLFANSAMIIMSLIICLTMSYLADFVGLSAVIGAFIAGIAVAQTSAVKEIEHQITALGYAVFIPVFFVNIGLEVHFTGIASQFSLILLLTVVAVLSKLIGGYIGGKMAGFHRDSSLMIGAGMVSRGEMALIILQLGYQNQLVQENLYAPFLIVILLSTFASPLLLKHYTQKLY